MRDQRTASLFRGDTRDQVTGLAFDQQTTEAGVRRPPVAERGMSRIGITIPDHGRFELLQAPAEARESFAKRSGADKVHAVGPLAAAGPDVAGSPPRPS